MAIQIREGALRRAVNWFSRKIRDLGSRADANKGEVNIRKVKNFASFVKKMVIGGIYFQAYDPKFKKELPFYDKLPLYIPAQIKSDRILGLNLHYLPPQLRVAFLQDYVEYLEKRAFEAGYDFLYEVPSSQISNWGSRYISKVYLGAVKSPGNPLRECVKTYLYGHIVSKISPVKIDNWEHVGNLILPQFEKKSDSYIYRNVIESYKKYKDSIRSDIFS
jgi:hypothetical protein